MLRSHVNSSDVAASKSASLQGEDCCISDTVICGKVLKKKVLIQSIKNMMCIDLDMLVSPGNDVHRLPLKVPDSSLFGNERIPIGISRIPCARGLSQA